MNWNLDRLPTGIGILKSGLKFTIQTFHINQLVNQLFQSIHVMPRAPPSVLFVCLLNGWKMWTIPYYLSGNIGGLKSLSNISQIIKLKYSKSSNINKCIYILFQCTVRALYGITLLEGLQCSMLQFAKLYFIKMFWTRIHQTLTMLILKNNFIGFMYMPFSRLFY